MREIKYTTQFRKDYRNLNRRPGFIKLNSRLTELITMLQMDLQLNQKHRDHGLTGTLHGLRECHITPDLLLIYSKPNNDELILIRLGSNSDLF